MVDTTHNGKGLRRFIWQVCAFSFLDDCVFIYSWYAVMFADHGLDAAQISTLFAVWCVAEFVLEIPSGALADKYSRRHILAFAQFVRVCGYACWMLFPTFGGFLTGFVCWGVKSAFISGTCEALVYDELKHFGAERHYARIIGRMGACANAGILISAIIAAPMIQLGYRPIIAVSLVPLAAAAIVALTMQPAKKAESTGEVYYLGMLEEGVREAIKNPNVLRLTVFISFALIFAALDEFYPLFYKAAGWSMAGIGILGAVATAVVTAGQALAYRFERLPDAAFHLAYGAAGGVLLLSACFMRPISAFGVMAVALALIVSQVVMETRLQHAIEGSARATVTSVKGFAENVAGVAVFLGFGAIAQKLGYRVGFMCFGAIMALIGAAFLAFGRRRTCIVSTTSEIREEVNE